MSERYYVDERVGCIVVRDRTQKSDRPHLDVEAHFAAYSGATRVNSS